MKKNLRIIGNTRTFLFIIAGLLAAGILLVSCGGGGYGGGGTYGGSGMGLPPAMFSLTTPANRATGVSTTPTLMWGASSYATGYSVYIKKGTDAVYPAPVAEATTNDMITTPLTGATLYDWYVVATNSSGMATSATFTFTTM
jgi:trimeric autotransporter adhesin